MAFKHLVRLMVAKERTAVRAGIDIAAIMAADVWRIAPSIQKEDDLFLFLQLFLYLRDQGIGEDIVFGIDDFSLRQIDDAGLRESPLVDPLG